MADNQVERDVNDVARFIKAGGTQGRINTKRMIIPMDQRLTNGIDMYTPLQTRLLTFLKATQYLGWPCPSYQEICTALELSSRSQVHQLFCQLEARGAIRRIPQKARA